MVADFIVMEGNTMCQCNNGGCSACQPRDNNLQFASGKEIEEFYDEVGESLYSDPAESTPEVGQLQ